MIGKPHNRFAAAVCRIERRAPVRCFELIAWRAPALAERDPHWPFRPGEALQTSARSCVLHIAPRRWLLVEPDGDIAERVERQVSGGAAVCVDVTGKWIEVKLSGPGAAFLLARTIDLACVLSDRDCAAVTLFDCPAVLSPTTDGFCIRVHASYEASLTESLHRLLRRE